MKEAHKKKRVLLRRICLLYVNNSTLIPFFVLRLIAQRRFFSSKTPLFASLLAVKFVCVSVSERVPFSVYKRLLTFFVE